MSPPPAPRILIADDEPLYRRTTAALLQKEGLECVCAADGREALKALEEGPVDLVLSDLNMPGNLQLELLEEGRRRWPETPLIVVTGAATLPSAIEAVRLGIADYLLKPVRFEELLTSVRRVLAQSARRRNASPSPSAAAFSELIGESAPMQRLKAMLSQIAVTDTNILITGESGTGKEVVARTIHQHSLRADQPFRVIDCTAIPETLFESLLFGHTRGAFTGAVKDQKGLLLEADHGTAFFDEIGELPLPLQSKLLRVIQEQTFTPLGQNETHQIDVRFLCATNRDLELQVRTGGFRQDLYYRLAVIPLVLPPLREREGDVLLLASHFLAQLQPTGRETLEFSDGAMIVLRRHRWPGNIRELRNAVEYAIAMSRTNVIQPSDLPASLQGPVDEAGSVAGGARAEVLDETERRYLINLLKENAGNVSRSASAAGLSRQGLHKLLRKHNIDAAEFRK
jgi:DNA-binding NtrC family response regulator